MARGPKPARRSNSKADQDLANTLAPAPDEHPAPSRARRQAGDQPPSWAQLLRFAAPAQGPKSRKTAAQPVLVKGVLPASIANQYVARPGLLRRHIDYYEGEADRRPAFRDRGGGLVAYRVDSATVISLVAIASHRNWRDLKVTGDRSFRRAVWLEAMRAGLHVRGYRPSARDREAALALETLPAAPKRVGQRSGARNAPDRAAQESSPERKAASRVHRDPALTFQRGVSGVLVEHGHAPYQHQPGAKSTPFVRVDIGAAKPFEVWGVDLSKTLQGAKVQPGDAITLSWHGADYSDVRIEKVAPASRSPKRARHPDPTQPSKAVGANPEGRDPVSAPAQARLAVIDAVARAKLDQPRDRAQIAAAAAAKLAEHMARGRSFTAPKVIERAVHPSLDLGPTRPAPTAQGRVR
ncbi:hypothetical protein GCM10010983_14710 [Caulobacter rhizosphaerae]|nr:hypothetical protein GCM10010983_14710 [Caulobacter rhizosphaerae]